MYFKSVTVKDFLFNSDDNFSRERKNGRHVNGAAGAGPFIAPTGIKRSQEAGNYWSFHRRRLSLLLPLSLSLSLSLYFSLSLSLSLSLVRLPSTIIRWQFFIRWRPKEESAGPLLPSFKSPSQGNNRRNDDNQKQNSFISFSHKKNYAFRAYLRAERSFFYLIFVFPPK